MWAIVIALALASPRAGAADNPAAGGADSAPARRTAWTAQITRKKSAAGGITGLGFDEAVVPVTLIPAEGKLRPVITVRGRFTRPGWQLSSGPNVLVTRDSPDPEFKLYAALNAKTSEIPLTATGPDGKKETEQLIILAPDVQEFRVARPWGELMASFGAASLSYFQTAYGNFSSATGYLKLGYTTPRGRSRFGAVAEAWTTLVTFNAKPTGLGPEVVGAGADLTYLLADPKANPYLPTLIAGVSYQTMLANGAPFGFANLIAPEIGVRALYPFGAESALTGDFRYVDLASGLLSLTQAGYDFRIGLGTRLSNGHRLELGFDAMLSNYSPDGSSTIEVNIASLRFGYSI